MSAEVPVLRDAIENDLLLYPSKKVLIHTVSYAIRNYLIETLSCQERLVTHEAITRESALENFKSSRQPLVMLSPSFDRGVDLPEKDNCAAVFICKMPYLSLGDPQVAAKVKTLGGWTWYYLKAAQTLMQMSNRHVRSYTQHGDTRIYDRQFTRLLGQTKNMIPMWWQKAIQEVSTEVNKIGSLI
jgi:Rad3-related DNA helicase